jgi:hypothetical protein
LLRVQVVTWAQPPAQIEEVEHVEEMSWQARVAELLLLLMPVSIEGAADVNRLIPTKLLMGTDAAAAVSKR